MSTPDLGNYRTIQPRARHVFECLLIIEEAKTIEEKVHLIRQHLVDNVPFKQLMMWNLIPRIESVFPKGTVPYDKNEYDGAHNKLWESLSLLPYFVKSTQSQRMLQSNQMLKLESMFIAMLESLPEQEADLIVKVKDGIGLNDYESLNAGLFYEASPTLFADIKDLIEEKTSEVEKPVEAEVEEKTVEVEKPKRKRRSKEEIATEKAEKARKKAEREAKKKAKLEEAERKKAVREAKKEQ